ncbi:MAG: hypothetical protein WC809_10600 [Sinimarinibacterium sp.]
MRGYPRRFVAVVWAALGLLWLSGAALIPGALERRLDWDVFVQLPRGSGLAVSATHAFVAFTMLFLFGALAPVHIRGGWRRRENRVTGAILVTSFAALALSALGVYYLADETSGLLASLIHLAIGCALAVPVAVHVILRPRRAVHPSRQVA